MALERPEMNEQEAEFVKEFAALMKRCPRTILFGFREEDTFKCGGKAHLSLMKKVPYGACGVVTPFVVKHA